MFDLLARWRLCFLQRVIESESLPLVLAHLMERQYLDALDIPQTRRKLRDSPDNLLSVGQAGYQDEADPDWSLACRQALREFERRANVLPGEVLVCRAPGLESQEDEIDLFEFGVGEAMTEIAVGLMTKRSCKSGSPPLTVSPPDITWRPRRYLRSSSTARCNGTAMPLLMFQVSGLWQ
jgi:hypothetical protein